MILSVSRRTDIPNYYSEWFFNRIKEGFVYVRNPMNALQVSKIDITPEVVDCIVFWTKNPEPMLNRLDELASYEYYFQFTLTGYGKDIERNVPHKKEKMIPIFQELSKKTGKKKVIWRYDPIIFTKKYTPDYHLKAFGQIARALKGYTEKCVISFVDVYAKNKKNMELLDSYEMDKNELLEFSKKIAEMAKNNGMTVGSCAESIDLKECGIEHNCCIDKTLIEDMIGCRLKAEKDKNQRQECGCVESVEIGTYDTCKNGCKYCYANYSEESVAKNCGKYDPESPILCGVLNENDKITERKLKSMKNLSYSHRNDILRYAAETYGTAPEYPWASSPDAAVLRHADNRKWYGLIMSVQKDRLGLSGTEPVDILNIKCDPILGSSLRTERGFLPAYHMNHEKWLTILLDGTVEPEKIYPLLEMSFELTKNTKKVSG